MRVRSLGWLGLAAIVGASVLQTSIPSDGGGPVAGPRVNFRLSPPVAPSPRIAESARTEVWAVSHAIAGSTAHVPGPKVPDGLDVVDLTLTVGAKEPVAVLTNASTIADLLVALDLKLGRLDVLKPGPKQPVWPGMKVRLVRIREVLRTQIDEDPFQTLTQYSKDLVVGQSRILEEGQVGHTERTFRIRFRNGREVRRDLVSQEVLAPPMNLLILKGTYQPVRNGPNREVGGASWYDLCPIWGMYAAHKTIAKGTLVHVRNLGNGATVDVVINDRGPYIDGRIIDLCQPAFAALAPLGAGVIDVEITW